MYMIMSMAEKAGVKYRIDEEHYNYDFHYEIANGYIPYLKEKNETG